MITRLTQHGRAGNIWQRQIDELQAEVRRLKVVRSPGVRPIQGRNGTTLMIEPKPVSSSGGTEAIVVWP